VISIRRLAPLAFAFVLAGPSALVAADPDPAPDAPAASPAADAGARRQAIWDGPSITKDGTTIIVPFNLDDGARGWTGLRLDVVGRNGKATKSLPIIEWGEDPAAPTAKSLARDSKRLIAANAFLDDLDRRKQLQPMTVITYTDESTHTHVVSATEGVAFVADLSPTGTLTLTPPGHAPVVRHDRAWRTQPSSADKRRIEADPKGIACFNARRLSRIAVDLPRRAAVIDLGYDGNDSCWEPSHDYVVVTW
jgi:hypothetical protein